MSKRDIVKYTKALVRAGVMKEPMWMRALDRTPPIPVGKPGPRPPRIEFPEDELVEAYYRKHPEARLEPIDLSSFEPPTARRFALRQLELIEAGMTKRAAYAMVDREFAAQRRQSEAAAGGARQSIIEQIQAEEEAHLQQAVWQYANSHGPQMVRQHAKEMWQAQNQGQSQGQNRTNKGQQQGQQQQPRQPRQGNNRAAAGQQAARAAPAAS